jgi:CRP/FNR family cyclic AMP-dependent transcriptional regulator
MELFPILRSVELFNGLSEGEIQQLAAICKERTYRQGEMIARQGESGNELFIVTEGYAEVRVSEGTSEGRVIVNLGKGQLVGEMSLVDFGPRSATVLAGTEPTILQVISREDFENLCQQNTNIGYVIMRNIASDLSFKLRHRNLSIGGR